MHSPFFVDILIVNHVFRMFPSNQNILKEKSDPTATYRFILPSSSISDVAPAWRTADSEYDVPLFRLNKLAFQEPEGLTLPLFMNKADAIISFERLQTSKVDNREVIVEPEVTATSILDVINPFNTGGFESRALEIFPDMVDVNEAAMLMNGN